MVVTAGWPLANSGVIGRGSELDRVGRFLDDDAAPSALILEGEAGIGKTTLWEWAVDRASGQTNDDMLEFADAVVANQFASEPEISIAALLAADLNDALVRTHRFHEVMAVAKHYGVPYADFRYPSAPPGADDGGGGQHA